MRNHRSKLVAAILFVGFALNCAGQNGLSGEYYDNQNFTGAKAIRTDPTINFDWGLGSPVPGFGSDSFSVRWTGEIIPRFTGTYTFYATSDDGVRLWINGQRLINGWSARLVTTDTATIDLKANKRYPIQLDFFEQTAGAIVSLAWSSFNQAFEIVPASQLIPSIPGVNRSPNTPVVFSPQADDTSVDPVEFLMKSDVFSDPDVADQHRCTQWEIWTVEPLERVWAAECQNTRNLASARLIDGAFENSHAGRNSLRILERYLLRVRHRDNSGSTSDWSDTAERRFNTLRPLVTVVPQGATWKYRDNSVDQGTVWRGTNFSDALWSSSRAQFGFGDGDESTFTCCISGSRPITTYFRRAFVMTNLAMVTHMTARLLRDDGGVVYINGVEVLRSGLPQSVSILYSTLASSSASDADEYYFFHSADFSPQLLHAGTNIVAVEVHQSSSTSSDLSFDFELLAGVKPGPPELRMSRMQGSCLLLSWSETKVVLEEAAGAGGPWFEVSGGTSSPVLVCDFDQARFFRLRRL